MTRSRTTLVIAGAIAAVTLAGASAAVAQTVNGCKIVANPTGSDLMGSTINGSATFSNVNLTNANLTGANLGSALFAGANLEGATLTRTRLFNVMSGKTVGVPPVLPPVDN